MTDFATALNQLWPNGDEKIAGLRAGMIETAGAVFEKHGIISKLVLAHIMAQASHECGAGHDVEENLSYTAQRICAVWPSRFGSPADALPYQRNPRALGNKVYGSRMGNRPGTDDGYNFRGRGGCQTTGRDGYAALAKATGLDLLNNPGLVNDPKNFMECLVAEFILCGCLPYAQKDAVVEVSGMLNVGHVVAADKIIGLPEREVWLKKWKDANVPVPARVIISTAPAHPLPDLPDPPMTKVPAPQSTSKPPGWAAFFLAILSALFKRK